MNKYVSFYVSYNIHAFSTLQVFPLRMFLRTLSDIFNRWEHQ